MNNEIYQELEEIRKELHTISNIMKSHSRIEIDEEKLTNLVAQAIHDRVLKDECSS